jgi:hypothetical protein
MRSGGAGHQLKAGIAALWAAIPTLDISSTSRYPVTFFLSLLLDELAFGFQRSVGLLVDKHNRAVFG